MVRIAILASGTGSNAAVLMDHFHMHPRAEVVMVGCDRPKAGVLQKAWDRGVPILTFSGDGLKNGRVQHELEGQRVDLIVLAGFLRLIPEAMVRAYRDRIVNIHPALLPKYGGQGMYGHRVHQAVLAAGDANSGITIHLVNERFDEGRHLLQVECPVLPDDTPDTLAQRVHELEHAHYAAAVEQLCNTIAGRQGLQGPIVH